ncbi:Uncharacterised protein [Mycobacteroides abscessus subsp. abscessus]|nr:Uncharacterised protein [Mycobacteroides abscessus subsp. abscessus]
MSVTLSGVVQNLTQDDCDDVKWALRQGNQPSVAACSPSGCLGPFGRFVGFRVVHYAGIAATAGPTIAARGTADIGPTSPWL